MKPEIDISQLSPAECILLAERLWERARNHPEAIPITEAQMAELNRRVDAYERGEMLPGEPSRATVNCTKTVAPAGVLGSTSCKYQSCATLRLITSTYQPNREPKSPPVSAWGLFAVLLLAVARGTLAGAASP